MATTPGATSVLRPPAVSPTGIGNEPRSANDGQTPTEIWERMSAWIAEKIGPHSFDTWFRPIRVAGGGPAGLRLTVPHDRFKQWLLENYSDILQEAVRQSARPGQELVVSVEPSADWENPSHTSGHQDEGAGDGPAPLRVIRASALEIAAARQKWLIENLWTTQAVGIVGGSPKCLKSFLTLEMAISVASGSHCLATFPVSQAGPVLLYAAEDSLSEVRLRLESLARRHQRGLEQLDINVIAADSLYLDRGIDQDRLTATVRLYHPALLILDPLVRLHTADENVAGQMAALLGYLRGLQRQTGVAVLVVHHARKQASPAGAGYSLRGSSDLYAWVDSFIYLQRRRGQLTLSVEHRSAPGLGPLGLELVESANGPYLQLTTTIPPGFSLEPDGLPRRILELLAKAAEPMTADRLRSILQIRNQRVVEALRSLAAAGQIVRLAQGYSINPTHPLG
jgi:AAA domain/DnaA N-terminal domain